jgi:AAA domain
MIYDMTVSSAINFDTVTESFNLAENQEQHAARQRIKAESTIPVTGPPGTGKSTVIARCCFDLIGEYSPVLVVAPTNAMVDSILVKIDYLLKNVKLELPKGFIIRYGNITELRYSYPYLSKYTLDVMVQEQHTHQFPGTVCNKIRMGMDLLQNARIILCTDYIAKDLQNVIEAGAIIVDEAGLVSLDKNGTAFSPLRNNNGKVVVIGDDRQLPPPSHDYVATSLFRSILRYFQTTLLRREYRFNQDILDLINPYYDYKLVADLSVSNISTADIAKKNYDGTNYNLRKILQHDKKIVFVDTNGSSREDKHFVNRGEVSIIGDVVDGCLSMGINSIMIMTPYKQQERMLQLYLQHHHDQGIRIGTVDKFQGQEDEVTIISMVRSNKNSDYHEAIGFVNIPRSCVAFSRSKRKTIIVGDRDTLIKSKFLSNSIDTITRKDGFSIWRDFQS